MKNNKFFGKFGAKGYYIALILCAAAIGIFGYLYYRNTTSDNPQLQDPTSDVNVQIPGGTDLPVVGTQPGDGGDHLGGNDPAKPTIPPVRDPLKTCAPLEGTTILGYAMDCLAYNETTRDWRTHDGIDIAAESGTAVRAAAAGQVYAVYSDEEMGMTVVIRHEDGYVTVYSSLSKEVSVQPGDSVTMGQTIGTVGDSALLECAVGDHLHFSVTKNGQSIDPADFVNMD